MPIVPINSIAYKPTNYEKRILYYMEIYREYKRDHKKFPELSVREVRDLSPKSKERFKHILNGKKYIINDGRHRLIAQKRLGYTTVNVKILGKR